MPPPQASSGGGSARASTYSGDLKVVALAAALENLAVAAYTNTLTRATTGKLGSVPPAIATFVTTVMKQHAEHAAAWNAVLTKANLPAVTGTPLTIASGAVAKLEAATTVPDVAKVALGLENAAADTYTFAAANVTDAGGIMTAATIQPVETMHAAILSFVLGEYPVSLSFIVRWRPGRQTRRPDGITEGDSRVPQPRRTIGRASAQWRYPVCSSSPSAPAAPAVARQVGEHVLSASWMPSVVVHVRLDEGQRDGDSRDQELRLLPEGPDGHQGHQGDLEVDVPLEHTVKASDGSFSSPPMSNGQTFSYTFTKVRHVHLSYCSIHQYMSATVTVRVSQAPRGDV